MLKLQNTTRVLEMDESALWEKIPQGKLTVPLWYTTRVFPLWETQRASLDPPPEGREVKRAGPTEKHFILVDRQYKSFQTQRFCQVEMKKPKH